jgi:hypothetical protein
MRSVLQRLSQPTRRRRLRAGTLLSAGVVAVLVICHPEAPWGAAHRWKVSAAATMVAEWVPYGRPPPLPNATRWCGRQIMPSTS